MKDVGQANQTMSDFLNKGFCYCERNGRICYAKEECLFSVSLMDFSADVTK